MRRILIVGNSGAGKTTLARAVSHRLALPLIHLDRHYWRPGWIAPDPADFRTEVATPAARQHWVMDGNYAGTLDLRLPRADLLVLVDPPWPLCLARVVRRRWDPRAAGRPDLPDGCPERLDLDFLRYVPRYPWRSRPRVLAAVAAHAPVLPVVRLRSRRQADRWFASLPVA
ncbi:AAA family ATPase [Micromonospora citrea]|uniref:AAA family ATPase n=1 Tax=Micromonospora citrea TaxID=47855 RepID=UPI003C41AD87